MKYMLKAKCEELLNGQGKLLLLSYAGSRLHGTNTENSDLDIKGVFLPNLQDRLNQTDQKVIKFSTGDNSSKNGSEDIDIELFNMFNFIDMLTTNDSAAVELLFSTYNRDMVLFADSFFTIILQKNRLNLLSNSVDKMTGFAFKMANKFIMKAERLSELDEVLTLLRELPERESLEDNEDKILSIINNHEHNSFDGEYFILLNRKFRKNLKVKELKKLLNKIKSKYGRRVKDIQEDKVDYKALSHALRAFVEAVYILEDKFITLPLPEADYLLEIKQGKHNVDTVNLEIERLSVLIDNLTMELGEANIKKFEVLNELNSCLYKI